MRRRFGLLFALTFALLLMVPALALGDTSNSGEGTNGNVVGPSSKISVDPDTRSKWKDWESDSSTRNVGRVWTDKTVYEAEEGSSSDFLTTLSAVSSGLNGSCPTKVVGGDASHSGYLTFKDELGQFIQVDAFTEVAIGGTSYGPANKTTSGNIDTYAFSGKAADVIITVERAVEGNPRQGDIVTVKVPASLIPTRAYTVDAAAGTFNVQGINDVSPIRITYASSVKDVARQNLFSPGSVEGLSDYIEANWDRDANAVAFYANKWRGNASGATTASFEPAASSSYYYFQEDTPIYDDEACTKRAMGKPEGGETYYYKDTFVTKGANGASVEDWTAVSFDGSSILELDSDSSGWFINKGTVRLDRIDQVHTKKTENVTGTASNVLDSGLNEGSSTVQSYLGNNGRINFSLATTSAVLNSREDFGLATELEGRSWTDDDSFTFGIILISGDDHGTDCLQRSTSVTKADLDEQGRAPIDFGNIVFTKAGTYVYRVSEDQGAAGGMSYSENVATVTIDVAADAAGVLHATVKSVDNPVFTNEYQAASERIELRGHKNLEIPDGLRGVNIAEKFTFTVTGEEGAPMPAHTSATNNLNGEVSFGNIEFTLKDLNDAIRRSGETGRSHTFAYTITESGNVPGVVNDPENTRTVKFTVTDDGEGNLEVARDPNGAHAFSFVNTYSVDPFNSSVTGQVSVVAQLIGRDLVAGEFNFELIEGSGGDETVVATGANDADGNVVLSAVTYTKPGKYTYTLREANGGTVGFGVTYSDATYVIETTVTDNGDGRLKAEHVLKNADSAVFENTYQAASTEVKFSGVKVLEGRELKADEFEFKLAGSNGAALTATNDEQGAISFDALSFDSLGTYTYFITEVAGEETGMTYDKGTCTATVDVTDSGKGQLVASVAYEKDGKQVDTARFINSYKAPEAPGASENTDSVDSEGQGSASNDSSDEKRDVLAPTGDSATTMLVAAIFLAIASTGIFVSYGRFRS